MQSNNSCLKKPGSAGLFYALRIKTATRWFRREMRTATAGLQKAGKID